MITNIIISGLIAATILTILHLWMSYVPTHDDTEIDKHRYKKEKEGIIKIEGKLLHIVKYRCPGCKHEMVKVHNLDENRVLVTTTDNVTEEVKGFIQR